jgi:thiol-disulfide isomerase/thioredoxin
MRNVRAFAAIFLTCFTAIIFAGRHKPVAAVTPDLILPSLITAISQAPQKPQALAPDFPAGLEWLNTDRPLSLKELRGKFVLLDFWTYGCINCMHIIPDLKRLEKKYGDSLVVIGVHSAKFETEKDSNNIREAIDRYDLEHPVVNDKDFLVWRTYGANAWPTVFLIDPDGKAVGYLSGEGVYAPIDQVITKLLPEFTAAKKIDRKPLKFVLEKDRKPKSILSHPGKIAADVKGGRLFFTDSNHHRVIVMSEYGDIREVIGEGIVGFKDGSYDVAQFFRPQGICYDPLANALYVADSDNHAIRKIDLTAHTVSTLAGNGKQLGYSPTGTLVGGVGISAELSTPWDLIQIGDLLYIAMAGTHQLWTFNLKTLAAEPYAGSSRENIKDGTLATAELAQPSGITTDGKDLYFADSESSAIRSADIAKGTVGTILGTGLFDFGDVDGKYPAARLQHPLGIAWRDGTLYVADTYNHKIKKVDPKTQAVETFIGTGKPGISDGPAKTAGLDQPNGLVFVGNKLYITDTDNNLIRVFDMATSTLSTVKLNGIEKLTKKTVPQFIGKVQQYPVKVVGADTKTLNILIQLPKGTKLNKNAPFVVKAASDKPELVGVGTVDTSNPAVHLSIPISPKLGQATITVDVSVNYCSEGNEGLCYFKQARLVVPVKVSGTGGQAASITYTP